MSKRVRRAAVTASFSAFALFSAVAFESQVIGHMVDTRACTDPQECLCLDGSSVHPVLKICML